MTDRVDTDTRIVTISDVDYRIDPSDPGHYEVVRLSDGAKVGTIDMIGRDEARDAYAGPVTYQVANPLSHDTMLRIANAAKSTGLAR